MNKKKKSVLKLPNIFKPQKPTLNPKRIFTLGLIVMAAAFFSYLAVRQLYLYQLRYRFTARSSPVAVYDPVRLMKQLKSQDETLLVIDLRRKQDFAKGHLRGSVNQPWQGNLNDWLSSFYELKAKDKIIVIHEHSQASVAPQEIALYLRRAGFSAYYLAIGYNEWRHFHTFWLPESEWGKWQVEQYVDLKEE